MKFDWHVKPLDAIGNDFWLEWSELLSRYHKDNPMLGGAFVKRLIEYFPQNLYVARACSTQGETKALCFLHREKNWGLWKIYKPSQAQAALLVSVDNIDLRFHDLIKKIPAPCLRLDVYALDPREHSSVIREVPEHLLSVSAKNMTINVEGTFENYWSTRGKTLRKNIRRYINRIEKSGAELKFKVVSDSEHILKSTDLYGMLESRGWKGAIGTALHPGNHQGNFYRNYMGDMSDKGQAIIFELYIDDELVASRLCVYSEHILVILKTTYDEQCSQYSVGKLLLYFTLQYIFNNRASKIVDFYTNASRDQMDWATDSRGMLNASLYRHSLIESVFSAVRRMKGLVK